MIRSQILWATALLLLGVAGCDVATDPDDLRNAADPNTATTTAAAVGQQAVETLGRASAVLPSDAPAPVSGPSCALAPCQPGEAAVDARTLLAFVAASLAALQGRRRRRPGRKDVSAVIWGLVLVGWLGSSRPAQAADAQASREHFKKGSAAYDLGRFDEAIKEFEAAYQARSDPALLFNIGQAHRLLGHVDAALRSYRAYLRKAPRAPNRGEVQARIKTMEAAALNDTVLRPGEGGRLDAQGGIQPPGPEDGSMALTDSESSSSPGTGRRVAGLLTLGLGAAAIAGGVAWRLSADADAQRVTQAGKDGQRFDQSLQDLEREGLRNHTLGTLSIAVGSAAVVAGAVLYFLGPPSGEGPRDAASFQSAFLTGTTGTLRFTF
jgi:tetratricopeptide (TPR) repeat protein